MTALRRALDKRRCLHLALGCSALMWMLAGGAQASAAGPKGASFKANGSVQQVYVTGLQPKAKMTLLDSAGHAVATKRADEQGGLLFRGVKPGNGYRVRLGSSSAKSGPLRGLSTRPAPPSTKVYDQSIASNGYQYLTTRDGTKLAIDVHPPQDVTTVVPGFHPPVYPNGQTPTLIEYSG